MFSALKVNGKKLYHLAREGTVLELAARPITIHELRVWRASPENQDVHFSMKCTKVRLPGHAEA